MLPRSERETLCAERADRRDDRVIKEHLVHPDGILKPGSSLYDKYRSTRRLVGFHKSKLQRPKRVVDDSISFWACNPPRF
jgi:hypothetical protein